MFTVYDCKQIFILVYKLMNESGMRYDFLDL